MRQKLPKLVQNDRKLVDNEVKLCKNIAKITCRCIGVKINLDWNDNLDWRDIH